MNLNDTAVWSIIRKISVRVQQNLQPKTTWMAEHTSHLTLLSKKPTPSKSTTNSQSMPYLPAISASSPIFEGKTSFDQDNRLQFYRVNQKEVPSVMGEVIPEYVSSLSKYKRDVIERYSSDLAKAGADKTLLHREWVNSRGVIFRFDRCAIEVRVMDEQECVKSDVALAAL
jgi:hypothetical protein